MSNSSTRDYSYDYKPHNHNKYQQRNQSKKYQQQHHRDRSRSDSKRYSNRDFKRQLSRSRQRKRDTPCIKIQSKPKIVIFGGVPKSEIKYHFLFNRIQIDPNHEQQLMTELRKYFENEYGAVQHLSKSFDSKPGSLVIKLGFQTDSAALKALNGKIGQLSISMDEKLIDICAKPTFTFDAWLKYRNSLKTQKRRDSQSSQRINDRERSRNKRSIDKSRKDFRRRLHSRSDSQISQFSSRSSSSSLEKSRQSNKRKNETLTCSRKESSQDQSGSFNSYNRDIKNDYNAMKKDSDNSKNQSFEPECPTRVQVSLKTRSNETSQIYKKLIFWGLSAKTNAKKVDDFLQRHRDGCFVSKKELAWKKIEGSQFCQVLFGQFQEETAQKILRTEVPMEIDGCSFIVIDADFESKRQYIQKLSQYQVNIQLPTKVQPYYLMKSLKQCGKVIQIVSNNKFTEQGLSDSYNVTFASKEVCKKFKAIRKTSKGIIINQILSPEEFVPIYRANLKFQQESQMDSQHSKISQNFSAKSSENRTPQRSPYSVNSK